MFIVLSQLTIVRDLLIWPPPQGLSQTDHGNQDENPHVFAPLGQPSVSLMFVGQGSPPALFAWIIDRTRNFWDTCLESQPTHRDQAEAIQFCSPVQA
jgi:hypothetical protein